MANRVRAHTRRTKNGKTTRVQQHTRKGRPRKALVSPRHAWELVKRARRASKRKKTVLAVTLGGLAVAEFGAWLTLDGIRLVAFTAGVVAIGAAGLAAMATGHE